MGKTVIEAFVPSGQATPDVSEGFFEGDPALIAEFVAVRSNKWDAHNVRLVTHDIKEILPAAVAQVAKVVGDFKVAEAAFQAVQKPVAAVVAIEPTTPVLPLPA